MTPKWDVYLAGSMHFRLGSTVLAERREAKRVLKALGLTWYDPAADEDIHPSRIITGRPSLDTMRRYVKKDDSHVDQCRVLLVLTGDRCSVGTMYEAGRMLYKNKRPIYVVSKDLAANNIVNFHTVKAQCHPSVRSAASAIYLEVKHAVHRTRH